MSVELHEKLPFPEAQVFHALHVFRREWDQFISGISLGFATFRWKECVVKEVGKPLLYQFCVAWTESFLPSFGLSRTNLLWAVATALFTLHEVVVCVPVHLELTTCVTHL